MHACLATADVTQHREEGASVDASPSIFTPDAKTSTPTHPCRGFPSLVNAAAAADNATYPAPAPPASATDIKTVGVEPSKPPQQHQGRPFPHLCSLRVALVAPIQPPTAAARPLKRQLQQTPGKVQSFAERQRFPCSLERYLYRPVAENDLRLCLVSRAKGGRERAWMCRKSGGG